MTEKQKQFSIRNKKLRLSFWDKVSHFGIVIFLFFIPIISIFVYLKDTVNGTPHQITDGEIYLFLIPTLLALVFYKIQADRLKFKEVHTALSKQELKAIIEKTGNILNWHPKQITDDFIIATTNPSFSSGSWGEQITILFDNNRVLINSICDPDKKSSVLSMGRNKKNVTKLIEDIQNASR